MDNEVAIIGVGLHPFGRTDGLSGQQQGAYALREALKDAGVEWKQVGVAYGGSQDGGNADALSNHLGLTGIPFVNVANGCATGGSALASVIAAIQSGMAEIGVAVGFDKHPRGAFNPRPKDWGLEDWYGETGLMLTTQFFALKTQRYMFEHGITDDALVRIAQRAFRNGALTPHAWRRRELSYEEIAESMPVNLPPSMPHIRMRSANTCSATRPKAARRWCCAAQSMPASSPPTRSS